MKTPLRTLLLAAGATTALAAGQAQAGLVTVTNLAIPVYETVDLNNITPGAPIDVYAGQNVFTTSMLTTIDAWCIDVFHDITLGGLNDTFNDIPFAPGATDNATPTAHLLTTPVIDKLAGLFTIGTDILQDGELNAFNAHYGTAGATLSDWSAAIQLAIWDTEYQPNYGTLNWSGGSTTADTRIVYDDLIADASITGTGFELAAVGGQQSFGGTDPVPEPATLALLAVGLIGAGFARRLRFRGAATA
jgi:hypothetical protein